MSLTLEQELDNNFSKYTELWSKQLYFDAIARLGENYLFLQDADPPIKNRWIDKLLEVRLTSEIVHLISEEANREQESLNKILYGGGYYEYEEAVLIISKRVDLLEVMVFLNEQFEIDIGVDLSNIDEEIKELSESKANRLQIKQAINKIKESCGYSSRIISMLNDYEG